METRVSDGVLPLIARIERLSALRMGEALAPLGINYAESRIVAMLWGAPRGLAQKDLAGRLRLDPSGVSVSLRRLEAKEVVERHRDPDDSRLVRVRCLTGMPSLGKVTTIVRDIEARATAGLGTKEKAALLGALRAVDAALSQDAQQAPAGEAPRLARYSQRKPKYESASSRYVLIAALVAGAN